MFAAAVVVEDTDDLPAGIGDSKTLAPERREAFAEQFREDDTIEVGVAEIPTSQIDDPETDMNTLTVKAHAEAISQVAKENAQGIVDACDTSESRFARRVTEGIEYPIEITAEHGADETHTIVGAASIVAKVERDTHVAELEEKHGEVGSGYPSDPKTRTFLRDYVESHGELPDCARASWQTSKDALSACEQSALDQF
ncbi:ribonuclease HII [Halobacterium noricense]